MSLNYRFINSLVSNEEFKKIELNVSLERKKGWKFCKKRKYDVTVLYVCEHMNYEE